MGINKMQRMCTGDKDKCDLGEDDCHDNAVCTDTDGSFTCACKFGYSGDGKTCTSTQWFCAVHIDKGVLLKSWTLEGARAQLAHGSQANRQAIIPMTGNKAGDPHTLDKSWDGGSMWWGDWHDINKMQRMCTGDKDKCDLGEDDCHDNAVCTDTDGSFTCACKSGYSGDGKTCTNKDECDLGEDDCHDNAVCTDTDGLFTCACKSGYSGDGKTCTNKDECDLGEDDCHN